MNKKRISELDKVFKADIVNLANLSLGEDKTEALKSMKAEAEIMLAYEKEKTEEEEKKKQSVLDKEKLSFEEEKFESDKEIKEKQIKLDEYKFDLDKQKFQHEIENDRLQNELAIKKMENESKNAKIQIIISAVGVISTFALGLIGKVMYNKLAKNAQIHEFNDYQMEPASSKENRMNLLK